ncbi:hypothetical protein ACIBEJ_35970 [Nonomuraea sp. NPDC050790]|uniref:hypothetical protein n=1 Tax=Nonomuraea sp. NPDC050790 TaxID=3364371 RepID=UPI0037A20946
MSAWEDYTEALGVLARAAETGRGRLDAVEAKAEQAVSAAGKRLATAVQERRQVERRLAQLDGLCHKVMTEGEVPREGAADRFDLGTPSTARAVLATLDRLEEGLNESLAELLAARSLAADTAPPPPPPPRPAAPPSPRPVLAYALIGAVALVIVLVLVIGVV